MTPADLPGNCFLKISDLKKKKNELPRKNARGREGERGEGKRSSKRRRGGGRHADRVRDGERKGQRERARE